jgi:hypothetical protein
LAAWREKKSFPQRRKGAKKETDSRTLKVYVVGLVIKPASVVTDVQEFAPAKGAKNAKILMIENSRPFAGLTKINFSSPASRFFRRSSSIFAP